ncbi:hypothetical protein Pla52o_24430 [Novipirellula galeiformis]|uniref:Oligosaccharide repeat unit polymerase n=1 Tax=Novipirellula galeiformis TaxID=2528004 RepID=A0A5C6CHX8_9BACT|nr:hypothetical protein [Novipirellula galeiformis]TWU22911.1 hypothetical protein Pla52o_24430 [Novipirellula galeiformis]
MTNSEQLLPILIHWREDKMSTAATGDGSNLQLPTPLSACLISAAVFGFFHLTSPFSFALEYDYQTWFFLFLNIIAISLPAILYRFSRYGAKQRSQIGSGIPTDSWFLQLGVWLLIGLALLGTILKCYDLFVARGFSVTSNVNELYEQNSEISSSMAGLVSSLLYPLAFPTLIISLALHQSAKPSAKQIWKVAIILSILACLVAPLNAVMLGKRGAVFSVTILAALASYYSGIRLRKRTMLAATLVAFALFVFSTRMLSYRLEYMGASTEAAVEAGRFTDLLVMSPNYRSVARHSAMPDSLRATFYDWSVIQAYVVHAVPEYLFAIENFDSSEYQHGKFTFSLVAKFSSYFSDIHYDAKATAEVPPRTYIYSTLFGPLFFDFGFASVLVTLSIGVSFVFVYNFAKRDAVLVPLYLYLYTVVLVCPIICFLNMFYGFYYLTASISAAIFLKFCSRIRSFQSINHRAMS